MNQQSQRLCPFTMRAPEASSIIAPGGAPKGQIVAAPCAGMACQAFTVIHDEHGKPVAGDCRLCMNAQMTNNLATLLDATNQLIGMGLKAQGIEPPPTNENEKERH